jgi:HPt (histidine-containing phosphotransfer) domain-containing protein
MSELSLPTSATQAQFDDAALLDCVDGDAELLCEAVELFLGDIPRLRDAVRSALAAGDVGELKRSAHSLKRAASNFGAGAVVAGALRMETPGRDADLAAAMAACAQLDAALDALEAALPPLHLAAGPTEG